MSEITSRLVHAPIRSVVCETKFDVCDIIQSKKKQKQHSSQQKQHNRNSTQHRITVYIHPLPFRSIVVCIGVRTAILHRCSHLTSIPPSCIGARTLHFSCVPFRWSYRLAFRVCVCHSNSYTRLFVARCVAASPCRTRRSR